MLNFLNRKPYKVELLSLDILEKIEHDFKEEKRTAIELLIQALNKWEYLRSERIIRCIVFLAKKDLNQLQDSVDDAYQDPRDAMYWAEYINRRALGDSKRVRNFNNRFDENDLTITDQNH